MMSSGSLVSMHWGKLYRAESEKVLIDVKSILDKRAVEEAGYRYWRL
jgi:hypothetical protein